MRLYQNKSACIRRATLGCILLFAIQPNASSQQQKLNQNQGQDQPVIKERTAVVTVNVSVTDKQYRQISGLSKEHFEIYEDKVLQNIEFFSDEDKPVSVGIIFDLSGSMKDKMGRARDALKAFVDTCHNDDEFFLVGFNERATLLAGLSDGTTILRRLGMADPRGQTALYDAAYLGVEKVKEGRHDKRALLIISDGQDNASKYSYGELKKLLKEADVQIYCIGINEGILGADSILERQGQMLLDEMAQSTGGMAFNPNSYSELDDSVRRIALALRHQYSIGYVPLNDQRDGKWRKIKVRINRPKGMPSLVVRAKEGYYATQ